MLTLLSYVHEGRIAPNKEYVPTTVILGTIGFVDMAKSSRQDVKFKIGRGSQRMVEQLKKLSFSVHKTFYMFLMYLP